MKKILQWVGIGVAVVFLGMQFVRPERTNPPIDETRTIYARVNVPPDVKAIIERSCNDCHSYNTRWPWYSNFAPAMWLVAHDVKEGREHMNLSDFAQYKDLRAVAKLDMICEQLENGNMPLPNYLILHPGAKLSKEEADRICEWVETARDSLLSSSE